MHHPLVELEALQLAVAADAHLAHHAHAIDFRIQRTQSVGQGFRQHGHHMPGKINRVAPLPSLFIELGTDRDIVGDVGDGHDQPPVARAQSLAMDGVVKVPGVFGIDGNQGQIAQVETTFTFGGQDLGR